MADKHVITLEVLREYGTDLSIPREVEFNIVSLSPIDEKILHALVSQYDWRAAVEKINDIYMATLTARLIIAEETIRRLSEAVERFCQQHGWDYDGWGASTYK